MREAEKLPDAGAEQPETTAATSAPAAPASRAVRFSRWSLFTGGLAFCVAFFLPFVEGCVPIFPANYIAETTWKFEAANFRSLENSVGFFSEYAFLFPYLHAFFIAACALLAWHARPAKLAKLLVALACISVALESICQFKWYCGVRIYFGDTEVKLTPYNIGPFVTFGWLIVGLLILAARNAADGRSRVLWAAAAALLPHSVWHALFANDLSIGWIVSASATLLYLLSVIVGLRALRVKAGVREGPSVTRPP